MGEGKEQVGGVALLEHALVHHRVGDGAVVGVREQAALGRAGGARGVDVETDVVRADRLVAGLPLGLVAPAPALAQRLERDRVVAQVGAGRVDHDDVAKLRAPRADLAHLGQLLGVLHEDRPRIRVVEHVLAFLRGVGLVDRDERRARREDSEAGVGPFRTRMGEDRDLVARLHAQVHQPEGHLAHHTAQLRVGDVDPLVAHLVALRGLVGVPLDRQRQQVRDGLRARAPRGCAGGDCFHGCSPSPVRSLAAQPSAARTILWAEEERGHSVAPPETVASAGSGPRRDG